MTALDDGGRQSCPAVRAAVITRLEHSGDLVLGPRGPDRKAVAHRLRHRDHVGHDAGMLEPEPFTRSAEASLNLVEHHQQPTVIAQGAHVAEVLIVGGDHPALALHRLQQHRRNGRVDRRLQRVDVVVGDMAKPVRHREERLVLGRLAGSGQRRQRATVEAAERADDGVAAAAAELARQFQRRLVGLGAAVAEEHLPDGAGGLGEQRVDLDGRLGCLVGREEVADVHQRARLCRDHLRDAGIRVAECDHREPTEEVEVPLAVVVPQLGTAATDEHHLWRAEHRHERAHGRRCRRVEGV